MDSRQIFVIGATGYIGSHVSRRLIAEGHQVIGFARSQAGMVKLQSAGIAGALGDLSDLPPLVARARAADVTIFAPQLSPDEEYAAVEGFLTGMAGSGKRFIFTSGTGVLGQRTGGCWHEASYAEDDDIPFSTLVRRRVEVEKMVRASPERGVEGIVIRASAVWGHGFHPIAERLLTSYEKTGAICYVGDGMNCYSSVNIDDLADLYLSAAQSGVSGALYHAASGEINNRAIAELLASRLACSTRSVTMDEAIDIWGKFATLIVLSVSSRTRCPRSRAELNWSPTRTNVIDCILHDALQPG